MARHNLGVVESTFLVVFFVTAKIYLAFPRIMVDVGGTAAWMVPLIGGCAATVTWWAVWGLSRRYAGQSLVQATERALGPVFGTLVNLVYAAFFHAITFLVLRQFSENIASSILPKTPLNIITLAFLSVACYGVLLGLEGLARVVWLVTPFTLIALVVLLVGGIYTQSAEYPLFPFWGWGAVPTIMWGLAKVSSFAELLLLGLLLPHFRDSGSLKVVARWSIGLSIVVMVGTVLFYQYIFPWPGGGRVSFPLLEVSRLIITGRWVQRMESVFFLVWIIMATLSAATGLYATVRTLAETIGLENERHLVLPVALTVYSMAQAPNNLSAAVAWDSDGIRVWGWIVTVALPLLTLLVSTIRGKGTDRAS